MRRFGCSISSSTEPTGDRSWDVRTFLVGVVAVAFAVVLNCLVSLWCRIVLNEPLSHHCRSVDRCRYLNYLRRTRHCQRAMVVMNLAMTEEKRKNQSTSQKRSSQNILVGFSRLNGQLVERQPRKGYFDGRWDGFRSLSVIVYQT